MSALVIDTSSWVSYFAGRSRGLIDEALAGGRVVLPPIVVAELTSGTLKKAERRALCELLEDLPLCETPLAHWFSVGALRADLRARGLSVSTPDAHVAQCALDLDAALLTEDRVFRLISNKCALKLAVDRA